MSATESEIIESKAIHTLIEASALMAELALWANQYPAYFGSKTARQGHGALMQRAELMLLDIKDLVDRSEAAAESKIQVADADDGEQPAMFCAKCGASLALHEMRVVCP